MGELNWLSSKESELSINAYRRSDDSFCRVFPKAWPLRLRFPSNMIGLRGNFASNSRWLQYIVEFHRKFFHPGCRLQPGLCDKSGSSPCPWYVICDRIVPRQKALDEKRFGNGLPDMSILDSNTSCSSPKMNVLGSKTVYAIEVDPLSPSGCFLCRKSVLERSEIWCGVRMGYSRFLSLLSRWGDVKPG